MIAYLGELSFRQPLKNLTNYNIRCMIGTEYRSARLSLQSSELDPPTPSPADECCPSPLVPGGGGTHSLAGERVGGSNSDDGTDTVVF
jgi:hypothetical protein